MKNLSKWGGVTAFTASLLAISTPVQAATLTFNYSFTSGSSSVLVSPGIEFKGTLNGLVEGRNSGFGITATTDVPPGFGFSGLITLPFDNNVAPPQGGDQNAFTVVNGEIVFANANFVTGDLNLSFNTSSIGGGAGRFSQNDMMIFFFFFRGAQAVSDGNGVKFTNTMPVPFKFNPALGLGVLAAAWIVKKKLIKKAK